METPFLPTVLFLIATGVSAQNLVHHWPLDEPSGTSATDIVGGSHGTLQNNCLWDPLGGHHGGALRANGNTAHVVLGPCDMTTGQGDAITLACWFKPDIVSGTERILMAKAIGGVSPQYVWSLSLVNGSAIRFRTATNGLARVVDTPPSNVTSGTWYHVAGVYDGAAMHIYLNGSLIVSEVAAGSLGYYPQAMATLCNTPDATHPFFGWMDDVRIYDHGLSDAEVIDLVIGNIATTVTEETTGPFLGPDLMFTRDAVVRVCDTSGRLLYTDRNQAGERLPTEGLPRGAYMVLCSNGTEKQVLRYVKP